MEDNNNNNNNNNNNPALGEERDFAVHASEPNVKPNVQKRGKGRERCLFVAQAGLASYLCRLCTLCLGAGATMGYRPAFPFSISKQVIASKTAGYVNKSRLHSGCVEICLGLLHYYVAISSSPGTSPAPSRISVRVCSSLASSYSST